MRSCWTDDPHLRPPFKHLAGQWERLLGNNARYLELETTAFSNPLYCVHSTASADTNAAVAPSTELNVPSAAAEPPPVVASEPLDRLDHLWHPPRANDHAIHTPDQSVAPQIPMGYDIPRPLMDTKTTEQNLRYENDLRTTPIRNGHIDREAARASESESDKLVRVGHYDTPVKQQQQLQQRRSKSYMDMVGVVEHKHKSMCGYNLDIQNLDKKSLSKDIEKFRVASLDLDYANMATTPL